MKYYAIPSFIKDLNKLCKKRQNGYYQVRSDITRVYEEVADILKVIELGDILHYVDDENQKLILKKGNLLGKTSMKMKSLSCWRNS